MEDTLGGRLAPEASAPERHLVGEPARRYTGDPCQEWADEEQHHGARGEGDDRWKLTAEGRRALGLPAVAKN